MRSKITPFLIALLLSCSSHVGTREPADVSSWEVVQRSIEVIDASGTRQLVPMDSWERGNIGYTDHDLDGRIDHKWEVTTSEGAVSWIDTDSDGFFDREEVYDWGQVVSVRSIKPVRVPTTFR